MSDQPKAPSQTGILFCSSCGGEGTNYASRYGGNDPDVWPTGKCEACDGSGHQICEARGCGEPAIAFNEDGEALCEDCLAEWMTEMVTGSDGDMM